MPTEPNDPAYPTPLMDGLTKRELFAAMVLSGMASSSGILEALRIIQDNTGKRIAYIASLAATEYADALIAALNKTTAES